MTTKLKKLDADAEKITENSSDCLVNTNRMASIGMMVSGIAHEINNPLTTLRANLDSAIGNLKKLNSPSNDKNLIHLKSALSSVERIQKIAKGLKTFSHFNESKSDEVSIEQAMEMAIGLAWGELKGKAQVTKKYSSKLPLVRADESRLVQVFLNLIINAIQAFATDEIEKNKIEVTIKQVSKKIVVVISDNGIGIPKENQKKLFKPFFTTKSKGIGTGLGLPICEHILLGLGGNISFKSAVNVGTHFTISLPVKSLGSRP